MDRKELNETVLSLVNSSPFYRHMGMTAKIPGEGTSRLELPAAEITHNLYGTVHGGVLAALIDSACGVALGTVMAQGETIVTVDLRINFIAPVKQGVLIAEGKVIHKGRNTGVAEATIRSEEGQLVAKGMTTHFIQRVTQGASNGF